MKLEFQEYRTKKILNIHKHIDGPWYWGKYTAHPYVGCRSGCSFCYCRGYRYLGRRSPTSFDTQVGVKINAVEQIRGELFGLPMDIISVGDWQQPAESRYKLSRGMLEVVLEMGYPLFIVERSPLLIRDLDLLKEINKRSWVGVLYSISSLDPKIKRAFEPHSPGVRQRLNAMCALAKEGITTGISMMPILPFICDDQESVETLILAGKDHGASCVLAGGLTMDGIQAEFTLNGVRAFDPSLESSYRSLYHWSPGEKPQYSPPRDHNAKLGIIVRETCEKLGMLDRLPRYILPGRLEINKRIAERLFLKTYDLELEQAEGYRVWAYRKAAWTVDELEESLAAVYEDEGEVGLRKLPNIGASLAREIVSWLGDFMK